MADNGNAQPTIRPVDVSEIPAQTRAGKASKTLDEFMDANVPAAAVDGATKGYAVALRRYIKANELPVDVVSRKDGEGNVTHFLKRNDLAAASA